MSSSVSLEYLRTVLNRPGMSAQNLSGSAIAVIIAGTAIPLTTLTYLNGFTANGASTQFTVPETGVYLVMYNIEITAGLLVNSGVYRNGVAIPSLTRMPGLAASSFTCSNMISLAAGNVLQVTLFGLLGVATLRSGVGAYMNVTRIN